MCVCVCVCVDVDVCVCAYLNCVVFVNLLLFVFRVTTIVASYYGGPRIFFLIVTDVGYSDEESSSLISRPLQCWDGIVKQLADMAGPFSDFRNS